MTVTQDICQHRCRSCGSWSVPFIDCSSYAGPQSHGDPHFDVSPYILSWMLYFWMYVGTCPVTPQAFGLLTDLTFGAHLSSFIPSSTILVLLLLVTVMTVTWKIQWAKCQRHGFL